MSHLERRYIDVLALSAASLLAFIIGVNIAVDPYGMYRFVDIPGLNTHKPAIYHRVRLFKAYDVRRIKPQAIVLGSSRSHVGLRMSHPGWSSSASPRYNCAFDGATTKEMYFYLRHAHAMGPLIQVVLGLDTYHPTDAPGSTRPDFDAALLVKTRPSLFPVKSTVEDPKLLASYDTLRASITTLQSQNHKPEWFAADGQRLGQVFFREFEPKFRKSPRSYFEAIDRREVGFKLEGRSPGIEHVKVRAISEGTDQTSLQYIEHIIRFCRARNIDLRLFITPEHAHQLEIAAAAGSWASIEQAKRALVNLLAQDAAKHPGQQPFPLYDFSGYNSITTESLPLPGSRAEMKYYWDSSHFKQEVGDLVLDRLFGVSNPASPVPSDFGVELTAGTIDSALARIRRDQLVYRKSHQEEVSIIRSYVETGSSYSLRQR